MAGVRGKSGGHNRRSVAEHQANGTYRPSRHGREVALEATPAPEPPAYLADDAKAVWVEQAPALAAFGLLTALDAPKFGMWCIHTALYRRQYAAFTACLARSQATGVPVDTLRLTRAMRQEASTIQHLAVGFGLDPADRVRLRLTPRAAAPSALAKLMQTGPSLRPGRWAGVLK